MGYVSVNSDKELSGNCFLFSYNSVIAKSTAQLKEEWFFFEIFVLTPFWKVFFEEITGHLETDVAFFKLFEVVGGILKEIPNKEVFEIVVIFFESAFFFEAIIKAFEGRENVEIFAGPGGFMEDGVIIFEIEVKWFVDGGEIVGIEDKGRHQLHIFVDDTVFKLEFVV